ncbi:unnamed protein product [Timema podura]|uniref:PH domain-containing protein n=2 Tax=Timema TaxID=61471 RepID=A0ABN7NES7_TIMPD|nr:unnamed protein product [Timema podura]
MSRLTCRHPWSQGLVRGASAHFRIRDRAIQRREVLKEVKGKLDIVRDKGEETSTPQRRVPLTSSNTGHTSTTVKIRTEVEVTLNTPGGSKAPHSHHSLTPARVLISSSVSRDKENQGAKPITSEAIINYRTKTCDQETEEDEIDLEEEEEEQIRDKTADEKKGPRIQHGNKTSEKEQKAEPGLVHKSDGKTGKEQPQETKESEFRERRENEDVSRNVERTQQEKKDFELMEEASYFEESTSDEEDDREGDSNKNKGVVEEEEEDNDDDDDGNTPVCESAMRDVAKTRLQRLGVLYSDAQISSPIHRTEGNFVVEDGSPSLPQRPPAKTPGRLNRLAALAQTINSWEDDMSHPQIQKPPQETKPQRSRWEVKTATSPQKNISWHSKNNPTGVSSPRKGFANSGTNSRFDVGASSRLVGNTGEKGATFRSEKKLGDISSDSRFVKTTDNSQESSSNESSTNGRYNDTPINKATANKTAENLDKTTNSKFGKTVDLEPERRPTAFERGTDSKIVNKATNLKFGNKPDDVQSKSGGKQPSDVGNNSETSERVPSNKMAESVNTKISENREPVSKFENTRNDKVRIVSTLSKTTKNQPGQSGLAPKQVTWDRTDPQTLEKIESSEESSTESNLHSPTNPATVSSPRMAASNLHGSTSRLASPEKRPGGAFSPRMGLGALSPRKPLTEGSPKSGSVLHKAAAFEASSPTKRLANKDPTDLPVAERFKLFEQNKGQPLVPKAAFSMPVPSKQMTDIRKESPAGRDIRAGHMSANKLSSSTSTSALSSKVSTQAASTTGATNKSSATTVSTSKLPSATAATTSKANNAATSKTTNNATATNKVLAQRQMFEHGALAATVDSAVCVAKEERLKELRNLHSRWDKNKQLGSRPTSSEISSSDETQEEDKSEMQKGIEALVTRWNKIDKCLHPFKPSAPALSDTEQVSSGPPPPPPPQESQVTPGKLDKHRPNGRRRSGEKRHVTRWIQGEKRVNGCKKTRKERNLLVDKRKKKARSSEARPGKERYHVSEEELYQDRWRAYLHHTRATGDIASPEEQYPVLANVKRIKVSPTKPGRLYPCLSDIEATSTEAETDVQNDSESQSQRLVNTQLKTDYYQYSSPMASLVLSDRVDGFEKLPDQIIVSSEELESSSGDLGETSFGREILQAAGLHRSPVRPSPDTSSDDNNISLEESDVLDDMDQFLNEALADGDETQSDSDNNTPTPPKRSREAVLSPKKGGISHRSPTTAQSHSFKYTRGPQLSTPVSLPENNSQISLTHTVSFYRRQQNNMAIKTTPVRQIVRNPNHDQLGSSSDSNSCSVKDEATSVNQKISDLLDDVSKQQTIISQASQALNLCCATVEFTDSAEQVEGERLLLLATHRRQAAMNEIQRLKVEGTLKPQTGSSQSADLIDRGALIVSNITLPLKKDYLRRMAAEEKCHHFLCLLRCQEQVMATPVLAANSYNVQRSTMWLMFPGSLRLEGLYADFMATLEVYCIETQKEVLPHDVKYHINKDKKRLTPKKLKSESKLVMPVIQSPAGPSAVRTSSFSMAGYIVFSLKEVSRTQFTLNKVAYNSPLEGVIQLRMSSELTLDITHRGFLTMFQDVGGFGAWHRRWCLLKGAYLSYWKYPDDEKKKEPMGRIDLNKCITEVVGLVTRDLCARPNTFLLETRRVARPEDEDSLVLVRGNTHTLVRPDRGSNHDLPAIDGLVYCESGSLDHAATEVGHGIVLLVLFDVTTSAYYNGRVSDTCYPPILRKIEWRGALSLTKLLPCCEPGAYRQQERIISVFNLIGNAPLKVVN